MARAQPAENGHGGDGEPGSKHALKYRLGLSLITSGPANYYGGGTLMTTEDGYDEH